MFIYPLTLEVCSCTHSPSRYVSLASFYPLTISMCVWCLFTHAPSKLVPLYPVTLRIFVSVPVAENPQRNRSTECFRLVKKKNRFRIHLVQCGCTLSELLGFTIVLYFIRTGNLRRGELWVHETLRHVGGVRTAHGTHFRFPDSAQRRCLHVLPSSLPVRAIHL